MRSQRLLAAVLAAALLVPDGARADERAHRYFYEEIFEPFYAPDPEEPGLFHARRPGALAGEFEAVKSSDSFRVFVIGGSIAALLGNTRYPGDIGNVLRAALPSRKVELLNCGMAGYESFREALVEQEILEYAPDLIVLLTGHNEGIGSAPVPIWVLRARERLDQWSAYRALARRLASLAPRPQERTDATADARDLTFARNLRENLGQARRRGVRVAVVVPPRNYREPAESEQMFYDAPTVPGWLRFLRRDHAGALRLWRAALASGRPTSAQAAFIRGLIARAEEKLGRWDDARRSFEEAARADRASICGPVCQGILRGAAAEEGALLVEADRMFQRLAFPRMPGLETFNDRMHWRPGFNCLVGLELVSALRGDARLAALPWDRRRLEELAADCERPGRSPLSDEDALRVLGYVRMALSWPHFERLSPVAVFYLDAVKREKPAWFRDLPALVRRMQNPQTQVYGRVMGEDRVVLPRLYWHLGEARMLEADFGAAAADLERALRLDPALVWARLSLAVAEGLAGRRARAFENLRQAVSAAALGSERGAVVESARAIARELELGPIDQLLAADRGAWIDDPGAVVSAERRARILASLDQARRRRPSPPELRLIAQQYRKLGETRKFLELSDEVTRLYPEQLSLWIDRAEAALELGQRQKATEALARAQALGPSSEQQWSIVLARGRLEPGVGLGAAGRLALAHPWYWDGSKLSKAQRLEARAALEAALADHSAAAERRRIAPYYRWLGEIDTFIRLWNALEPEYGGEAVYWLERAEAALRAGDGPGGGAALDRAEKLRPSPDQLEQIRRQRSLSAAMPTSPKPK